jgi:hypothetical protein
MITPELLSYIKLQLREKEDEAFGEIKKTLTSRGWPSAEVDEAFLKIKAGPGHLPSVDQSAQLLQSRTRRLSAPRGDNRFIIALTLVVGALVLGIGVALAYIYYATPNLSSDQIIAKTLDNLAQVKSLEYAGDLRVNLRPAGVLAIGQKLDTSSSSFPMAASLARGIGNGQERVINVNLNGVADLQTPTDPRNSLLFNISTSPFGSTSPANLIGVN